eukprot:TRINITY_DN4308_c0_g1_i3.p1 TRINITY_DN4308_c0_g1~~TRINITY_DN4308_c0_g1_i3.p1  ORF type:complete len:186 (-),score=24.00 TRINITY_DN4308_c0_g1_i3:515-1072(-)
MADSLQLSASTTAETAEEKSTRLAEYWVSLYRREMNSEVRISAQAKKTLELAATNTTELDLDATEKSKSSLADKARRMQARQNVTSIKFSELINELLERKQVEKLSFEWIKREQDRAKAELLSLIVLNGLHKLHTINEEVKGQETVEMLREKIRNVKDKVEMPLAESRISLEKSDIEQGETTFWP